MSNDKVLGIILARKGSKRLPGKNKESLGDTKLVDLVLKKAKDAGIDTVAICTDYENLWHDVTPSGGTIIYVDRPDVLSLDEVPSTEVVAWVLEKIERMGWKYKYFCLLQLTAPLFHSKSLKKAIDDTIDMQLPACVSVTPAYKPSGNFYIVNVDVFKKIHHGLPGKDGLWPEGLSIVKLGWHECVDIDHLYDLRIAHAVFEHRVTMEGS